MNAPAPPRLGARNVTPQRLRAMLERLGPTFVKIGQYLALRPDILDEAYCAELMKLVDRVPVDGIAVARATIEAELGAPVEAHFLWLARQPIASGSLAEVYEARTLEGRDVALKVQRPGMEARIGRDLKRLRWLMRFLAASGVVPRDLAAELSATLRRWLYEEIDFERERLNLARIRRLCRDSETIRVPRPHAALSTRRLLCAQMLRGVPFSVLLRHVREGRPERIAALGIDQIFRHRLFHADSHPGNLLALADNRIGFVDFGLVETLEPTLERGLFSYVRAIYLNDVEAMIAGLDEILVPGELADRDGFRRAFLEENRRWQLARSGPRVAGQTPLGRYMMAVLRAARRHDLRLPAGILSIYRSLLTVEMVANQLSPDVDLGSVGRDFFARLQRDALLRLPEPEEVQSEILTLLDLLREGPRRLDRILADLAADRFRLQVEQALSPADRKRRAAEARLVSASILFVGLSVAAASVAALAPWPAPLAAWAVLALHLGWIATLWRRLT